MKNDVLIVTNGYKETWSAIEQGIWLAKNLESDITLLGVTENLSAAAIDDHHPLEDVFEKAVSMFKAEGLAYNLKVQNGSAEEVIPMQVKHKESIVVLSRLGRNQIKRFISGRSIRHFMEEIEQPILYVPQTRLPVKKILTCIGGLGYEVTAEHWAVKIAMKTRAEITLLHIAPQVDLEYPTSKAIREHWQNPEETDTPIGRSLRQALEVAKADGLTATIKGRQGNIVEEILAEAKEGNYDLLCMGSSYSVQSLRQMYSANVTAEIAESVHCPLLTARFKKTMDNG
jgi:nucleotide-binding universal stress UspA family protein